LFVVMVRAKCLLISKKGKIAHLTQSVRERKNLWRRSDRPSPLLSVPSPEPGINNTVELRYVPNGKGSGALPCRIDKRFLISLRFIRNNHLVFSRLLNKNPDGREDHSGNLYLWVTLLQLFLCTLQPDVVLLFPVYNPFPPYQLLFL